ncbi:Flp pilus assembly complex ATPase component TadA [Roseomonas sp. SSH11]|uniref:Flp pilus assembly complex ATPase component TadA n=1 Tax=Pararoseomonas baculiformis TaxID=2820812 RepID=A0ABS4AC21_9PROT|nr:GspE/PulE family protein [Pararoseomonas baculiformis]MBP0444557.1 Flp pilus assembly complex ATPase component TadA [Pararoseomonas baculiformis]
MDLALTDDAERCLTDLLLSRGLVTPATLARVEEARRVAHESLIPALLALGLVGEDILAATAAEALGRPLLARDDLPAEPPMIERLPSRFLRRVRAFPVRIEDGKLLLALADPLDAFAVQAASLATGMSVTVAVAPPAAIEAALAGLETAPAPPEAVTADLATAAPEDAARLRDQASEAPVIRHVNALILQAVESGASDIHLEATEAGLRTRMRVDGVLHHLSTVSPALGTGVISRLKIMARLDVAERRLPQDGRMRIAVRGRDIDLRVSVIPAMDGEGVVLRILDRGSVALDFDALGFTPDEIAAMHGLLAQTSRMVLVTGPTGSGKTTTLYAALGSLDRQRLKICTIEDPIEYRLEGVSQVQVRSQIGLTFPNALRAMLRHDPDVMLVGEIRDPETAEVAVQAALTGHLVLATLHTNDAPSAVARLMDLGVPDYLISSVLRGVLAQRLVRTLCKACREPYEPAPPLLERLGLARLAQGAPIRLHAPRGCPACGGTGYRGRTTVLQVMDVTDELRALMLRRPDGNSLASLAASQGMLTLQEAGLRKALAGITSIEEVMRVVGGS